MLQDLLFGSEESSFVLITDNPISRGRHLLLFWIEALFRRNDWVILLCIERRPSFFKELLMFDEQTRLICVYDETSPDLGLSKVMEEVQKVDGTLSVVLDALTMPILQTSITSTYMALHSLVNEPKVTQLVSLLHRSALDSEVCNMIERLAPTVIDVMTHESETDLTICEVRHRKATGKVMKKLEYYSYNEDFCLTKFGYFDSPENIAKMKAEAAQADPTAQLPFNLSLTETEKEARSQVKLPYLKESQEEENTSKILYQADDADDFDEEDPDDDLNI